MGEAKRRGSYQERVDKAVKRMEISLSSRQIRSQIDVQEHIQRLQAHRDRLESQMGPMDKLYVNQQQMLNAAAEKLKQMESTKTVIETPQATVMNIASPQSLGTVDESNVTIVE